VQLDHFSETQIIQCPSNKSFNSHLKAWDQIQKIGQLHDCHFDWNVLDEEEKTFILKINGCSKQNQQNAMIEVMKFLCKEGIEPAIIIETKDLNDNQNKLLKALSALESVNHG
jgi:lysophospholipid acyltransferase (LPLAT)-like uncharacterized protein